MPSTLVIAAIILYCSLISNNNAWTLEEEIASEARGDPTVHGHTSLNPQDPDESAIGLRPEHHEYRLPQVREFDWNIAFLWQHQLNAI